MIRFSNPLLLHLLWILPLILIGWWWTGRQVSARLNKFIRSSLATELISHNSRWITLLIRSLLLLAFALTIIGLAGPERAVMGEKQVTVGLDILLLIDTSKSMDAKDILPSRLGRAKQGLIYMVDHLEGHRVGIIQYAGEAFISCPFTQDKAALKLIIDDMQTKSLPIQGTDMLAGYRLALETFARNGAKHKIVILVSDGENFGAKPYQQIMQGKQKGIRLYCLGTGSKSGTGLVSGQEVMLDEKSNPVISRLKIKNLKKLADAGGGRYWTLTSTGYEEIELLTELNRLEKIKRFTTGYHHWQPYYPWIALLAGICILGSLMLSPRKKIKSFIQASLVMGLLLPQLAAADGYRQLMQDGLNAFTNQDLIQAERLFNQARNTNHQSTLADYNLGCALLAQKKLLPAYQAFNRAKEKKQRNLQHHTLYNLGYVAFYLGVQEGAANYWLEALDVYKTLLMNFPNDDEARYNIEIILREIKKRTKTAVPEQQESQGTEEGKEPGGGADKPGTERAQSQGKENKQAPPREKQEESQKRQNQGQQPKTSDDQQGRRQKGMSQQEALRTLKSLEAEETSIQKHWNQQQGETPSYQGPNW